MTNLTPELSRPARCDPVRSETAKRARLERDVSWVTSLDVLFVRLQPESSQDSRLVRAGKPLLRELLFLASHAQTVRACEISPLNSQA